MLRADDQITTTLQLIDQIRKIELSDVDKSGRSPMTDKHYFGMVKSVKFMLQRLKTNAKFTEHEREDALALLTAMSMLDRTQTPLSLFLDHDLQHLITCTSTMTNEKPTSHDETSTVRGLNYLKSSYKWLKSVAVNSFSWMWIPTWLVSAIVIEVQTSQISPYDCVSVF